MMSGRNSRQRHLSGVAIIVHAIGPVIRDCLVTFNCAWNSIYDHQHKRLKIYGQKNNKTTTMEYWQYIRKSIISNHIHIKNNNTIDIKSTIFISVIKLSKYLIKIK